MHSGEPSVHVPCEAEIMQGYDLAAPQREASVVIAALETRCLEHKSIAFNDLLIDSIIKGIIWYCYCCRWPALHHG
jgi:hypothetical protein